jgi:putative inorganic carbon (HCO3(-)) transporter
MLLETGEIRSRARNRRAMLKLMGVYVALLPIQINIALPWGGLMRVGPSDLVLAFLLVFCIWELRIVRGAWTWWHPILLLMLPMSVAMVLLTGGAMTMAILVSKVAGLFFLFGLYLAITSAARTWDDVWWLSRVFVGVVVLQNLVVTAMLLSGIDVPYVNGYGGRLNGMMPDPNAYGGLLIAALALHVGVAGSSKPLFRFPLNHVASITLVISIVLTSSRSVWVGVVALLMLLAVLRPAVGLRYAAMVGVVFALITLNLSSLLGDPLGPVHLTVAGGTQATTGGTQATTGGTQDPGGEELSSVGELALRPSTIGDRVLILKQALTGFRANPIFGTGLGQFSGEFGSVVHNTALWFLCEFGVLGFLVFCGLMGGTGWRTWLLYRTLGEPERSLVLGLGLAFVAMLGLSLGIEALYQRWWWLVMGLLGAARAVRVAQSPVPREDVR